MPDAGLHAAGSAGHEQENSSGQSSPGQRIDDRPRLSSLPGPSRLVRISDAAWTWLRTAVLAVGAEAGQPLGDLEDTLPSSDELAEPSEEQIRELHAAGILVDAPEVGPDPAAVPDGDAVPDPAAGPASDAAPDDTGGSEGELRLEPHWEQVLHAGLTSPVTVDLVCVDGADAWTSTLHLAGRAVLITDQVRELHADEVSLRLGRRSSAVLLGITTIDHLSATIEALVPQRPAFTSDDPAPAPEILADAPALAEVQMVVASRPTREQTVLGGGSFYAHGPDGEQLAVLTDAPDGTRAREVRPGALSAALRADVVGAISHATAVGRSLREQGAA